MTSLFTRNSETCNGCILNEIIRHALKSSYAAVKLLFQDFSLRNHRKTVTGLTMINKFPHSATQASAVSCCRSSSMGDLEITTI